MDQPMHAERVAPKRVMEATGRDNRLVRTVALTRQQVRYLLAVVEMRVALTEAHHSPRAYGAFVEVVRRMMATEAGLLPAADRG